MNYEALLKALEAYRQENSEAAYLKVRDGLIQKMITTPEGLAFVRYAFPDVDFNELKLSAPYDSESVNTLH